MTPLKKPIDVAAIWRQAITDVVEAGRDPKACTGCGRSLVGDVERERGVCSSCEVATWTAEKRAAMGRLCSMAFRTPKPSKAEVDDAIDAAFKEMGT